MKNKELMNTTIVIATLLIITCIVGHAQESKPKHQTLPAIPTGDAEDAWLLVKKTDSVDSYLSFLKHYPESDYAIEAKNRSKAKISDLFQVTKAYNSTKAQPFLEGHTINPAFEKMTPNYHSYMPNKGERFIIVEWNLGDFKVGEDGLRLDGSSLLLLVEGEKPDRGYASSVVAIKDGEPIVCWQPAQNVTFTPPKGRRIVGERLFIVSANKGDHHRLNFFGKEYPVIFKDESKKSR